MHVIVDEQGIQLNSTNEGYNKQALVKGFRQLTLAGCTPTIKPTYDWQSGVWLAILEFTPTTNVARVTYLAFRIQARAYNVLTKLEHTQASQYLRITLDTPSPSSIKNLKTIADQILLPEEIRVLSDCCIILDLTNASFIKRRK